MALPASGPRPIASSTWLAAILPELHAAPALTATCSRSSAITCASAGTPGSARQVVFGRRRFAISAHDGSDRDRRLFGASRSCGEPSQIVAGRRRDCRRETQRQGDRRGPAAAAALLAAACNQRCGKGRILGQEKGTDASRPTELVRRNRQAMGP